MGRKRAGAWAQRAKIKSDHTGCHPNKIRGNYNVANPILINKPRGLARPHYADSSKIGYVCEGECIAELISPEDSKEEVVKIQKGDTLPITVGTVSWWYNAGVKNIALLGEVGLSANRVVLEGGAVLGPIFTADFSVQLSYVMKGSGRVVIVELSSQVYGELSGGEISIWEAASPSILEASLNMPPDLTESLKSKIANGSVIAPPSTT
uniref:Globulin n=1 Tax=Solanum tuberosum TaxID=4113 RepID=M1DFP6_SOLTU